MQQQKKTLADQLAARKKQREQEELKKKKKKRSEWQVRYNRERIKKQREAKIAKEEERKLNSPYRRSKPNIKRDDARRILWLMFLDKENEEVKDLSFLLRKYQKDLYDSLKNNTKKRLVVLNHRRFGKSFVVLLYALEFAHLNPGCQIRLAAPTQKELNKIVHPIMKIIQLECPMKDRAKWNSSQGAYFLTNGSELHIAGTDGGHADSLRGTASHLNIIDEAGQCTDLEYVVKSILAPQTWDTGGATMLISTPPPDPNHAFVDFYQEALLKKAVIKISIYDNRENITDQMWEDAVEESGGEKTSHFRREYGCEFVVDSELALCQEWGENPNYDIPPIEKEYEYYHKYVFMDVGFSDFTYIGFGYYHFLDAKFVVEDEWFGQGKDTLTGNVAEVIKKKEKELWDRLPVHRRVIDNNDVRMRNELIVDHSIPFIPVKKTKRNTSTPDGTTPMETILHGFVNDVRTAVRQRRIVIDKERCPLLDSTLRNGTWDNPERKKFSKNKITGHQDAFAALMYLWRMLDQHTNPVPFVEYNEASTHSVLPNEARRLYEEQKRSNIRINTKKTSRQRRLERFNT